MSDERETSWVVIPWARLSADAQRGVIEEFVTREGTEYGAREVELETKVRDVRRQIERGEVVVVYDAVEETVSLATAEALRQGPTSKV